VNALAFWARKAGIARVIFEATGVYHRLVETGLAEHGISFARVNPRQAPLVHCPAMHCRQVIAGQSPRDGSAKGERIGRHWFETNRERPAGQNRPGALSAM